MIPFPSSGQVLGGLTDAIKAGVIALLNALGVSAVNAFTFGIPLIVANNGTIATNGTVTLGTALPAVYAKAWVWFPAGAVVGGSAGLYFVKFSSTTVGVVYTQYNAGNVNFLPYDPEVAGPDGRPAATLVVATGSNSGYTQTTGSDLVLATIPIGVGQLGINGVIRADIQSINNNSGGNKITRQKLGATTVNTTTATTDVVGQQTTNIRMRGQNAAQQINTKNFVAAAVAVTVAHGTENLAAGSTYQITGQLATATDHIVVDGGTIEFLANS